MSKMSKHKQIIDATALLDSDENVVAVELVPRKDDKTPGYIRIVRKDGSSVRVEMDDE